MVASYRQAQAFRSVLLPEQRGFCFEAFDACKDKSYNVKVQKENMYASITSA